MISSAFPIIATAQLPAMLEFYLDRLGGVQTYRFPDDGDPAFVSLELGSSHLGLGADPALADSTPSPRFTLWVYVDDCDVAVDHLRAVTTVITEPASQPWGERVATVLDPDGNLITIGSPARIRPTTDRLLP